MYFLSSSFLIQIEFRDYEVFMSYNFQFIGFIYVYIMICVRFGLGCIEGISFFM